MRRLKAMRRGQSMCNVAIEAYGAEAFQIVIIHLSYHWHRFSIDRGVRHESERRWALSTLRITTYERSKK